MQIRKISSLVVLITLFVSGATVACDMTVASTVRAVTVFRDRAQVERTAKVHVDRGENRIAIAGIAVDLNDESIRVTGNGTTDAAIVEVKVEPEYTAESAADEMRSMQAWVDSLNAILEHLRDQTTVLTTQRDFILALKTPATPGMPAAPRMSMKEFQELMTYVSKTLGELSVEQRTLDAKMRKLNDQINVTNKRIQDLRSQNSRSYKRIVVRVDADAAGSLDLVATYVIGNASWTPSYDAHVNTSTGEIEWTYIGNVRQETGENWKDVKLTLSTARPTTERDIPTLSAWFLHPYEPPQPYSMRKAGRGAPLEPGMSEMSAPPSIGFSAAGENMPVEKQIFKTRNVPVEIEEQLLATTFTIAAPMTIPSDPSTHRATISSTMLKGILQFVAVPRLTHDVYFRASTSNTSGTPFLGGPVNIFVDHQFVATSAIPTTVNSDSLQLSLGTNEAVKVDRRLVSKVQEYNGLLNKTFKWNYEYLTTITNNAKSDITIDVQDQLPISQNERIVIESQNITPAANETNDQKIMTWHWKLKPGEKKEIATKYSVEYPREMKIAGLE